jgi:hypothetical protein
MKPHRTNRRLSWKRGFFRVAVFLFVVYALADSTVLQAYCGNEKIGIPAAHHVRPPKAETIESVQAMRSDSHQSPTDHNSDQPCADDCLSGCSHLIVGSFFIDISDSLAYTRKSSTPIIYESKYSHSDVSYLFRPPRTA